MSKLLYKTSAVLVLLMPFGYLVWRVVTNDLGPDPIAIVADYTGLWSIIMLLIVLSLSPLKRMTGKSHLIKIRRQVGLVMFFYASLHVLTFFALQIGWQWPQLIEALTQQPYIILGATGYLLLMPLAVTSTNHWVRRLGRRWRLLHRLVYIALPIVFLHGWWQLRADGGELLPYLLWMMVILLERIADRFGLLPYRSQSVV
jgi:sulfoxide reductase heme-binding subunit YedZ